MVCSHRTVDERTVTPQPLGARGSQHGAQHPADEEVCPRDWTDAAGSLEVPVGAPMPGEAAQAGEAEQAEQAGAAEVVPPGALKGTRRALQRLRQQDNGCCSKGAHKANGT